MKFYKLKMNFPFAEANTIIADDGSSYEIKGEMFDTRSSVYHGEVAMLLDYMIKQKMTSFIEQMGVEDDQPHPKY